MFEQNLSGRAKGTEGHDADPQWKLRHQQPRGLAHRGKIRADVECVRYKKE